MKYHIDYTATALDHLDRITPAERKRIVKKIDLLAENPLPSGSKSLKGFSGFLRVRVGDYRVIYSLRRNIITVTIAAIGHRSDIYRKIITLLK